MGCLMGGVGVWWEGGRGLFDGREGGGCLMGRREGVV